MIPNVCVCIPWRPKPDRIRAHERVLKFWDYFGFKVVESDSDPEQPFHLAQARNRAIERSPYDTVITCDADTITDIGAVLRGLELVQTKGVVYPHTSFLHIPGSYVDSPDLMRAPIDKEYRNSDGGIFITTKTAYESVGRMDERFYPVWGYEDSAFRAAAETLSTVGRIPAVMMSFNHTVDGNRVMGIGNPNQFRYQLYKFAYRKPELMRELIK